MSEEVIPRDNHLAERSATAFACIGLARNSRGKQAPIARRILLKQPSAQTAELDGTVYDVATFSAASPALPPLICLLGDLKSAVIWVNGRHYPPGQHIQLYRWVVCHARMCAMQLPLSACEYRAGGYTIGCSLLGAFHAHAAPEDPSAYLAAAAARDGLDRCPRYRPSQ